LATTGAADGHSTSVQEARLIRRLWFWRAKRRGVVRLARVARSGHNTLHGAARNTATRHRKRAGAASDAPATAQVACHPLPLSNTHNSTHSTHVSAPGWGSVTRSTHWPRAAAFMAASGA
jgi:hypothetical protein